MLDGGHVLYYGIEPVRERPLGERAWELLVPDWQRFFGVSPMPFATLNDEVPIVLTR